MLHFPTSSIRCTRPERKSVGYAITVAVHKQRLPRLETGSCSCVGMVGATLGGGIGPYQGVHGLVIDALLSVTIVTGTGEIVTASSTENSDLFWGLRGAGHNFGIVTSATYQVHDQSNGGEAFNGDFVFPASSKENIFNIVKSFENNQPNELSVFTSIMYNSTTETVSFQNFTDGFSMG